MKNASSSALELAKSIQDDIPKLSKPPEEGYLAESQQVIDTSMVSKTRGYIEKITNQINGCYERGWLDGCSVMIRKLIETLIIEVYEHYGLTEKIKDTNGDFFLLDSLIGVILIEDKWTLGRETKKALPKIKKLGDRSAHARRYVAIPGDIEKIIEDIRITVQELIFLAGLK